MIKSPLLPRTMFLRLFIFASFRARRQKLGVELLEREREREREGGRERETSLHMSVTRGEQKREKGVTSSCTEAHNCCAM